MTAPAPAAWWARYLPLGLAGAILWRTSALLSGTELGSREGGWVYRVIGRCNAETLVTFVVVAACALILLRATSGVSERRAPAAVLAWLVFGLAAQLVIRELYPYSLAQVVRSSGANGFYDVSLQRSAFAFMRDPDGGPPVRSFHTSVNMPGKTLLYYFLELFSSSPAALGVMIVAVSNLGAVLAYLVARSVFASTRAAIYALALTLFLPAKLFFFPLLNTVTPVFILLAIFLVLRFLEARRSVYLVLLGPAIYALALFEPTPLALGIVALAFFGKHLVEGKLDARGLARALAVVIASFAAVHLAMIVFLRFDILRAFAASYRYNRQFNVATARGYGAALLANPVELFTGAGVLPSLLFCLATGSLAWRAARNRAILLEPRALFAAAVFASLGALLLIGVNRGEVLRLWIFLATFLEIAVAGYIAAELGPTVMAVVLAGTLLETIVAMCMIGFVLP